MTRKQHRASVVLDRVLRQAYTQIEAAHRPPAEANYTSILWAGGPGCRKIIRRQPGTLCGWIYHDTGTPVGTL